MTPDPLSDDAQRLLPGERGNTPLPGSLLFGPEHYLALGVMEEVFSALMAAAPAVYNPLVLHGGHGIGKSHLVRAITEAVRPVLGRNAVQYVRAAEFAQEMVEAIDSDDISAWRDRYRTAQCFVLDDFDHLAGKDLAQEELARTLDPLLAEGRQVIVIAHAPLGKTSGFATTLIARLAGGLSIKLSLPEEETRQRLVTHFADARQARFTPDAITLLARPAGESPLALSGAVTQLHAVAGHAEIDQAAVAAFLERRGAPKSIRVRDIAAAAARHFAIPLSSLRGNSRRKSVVAARGAAMWLARRMTDASLEQIGVYFGGRDHTTVLHACRRTEGLASSDQETRRAVEEIRSMLGVA